MVQWTGYPNRVLPLILRIKDSVLHAGLSQQLLQLRPTSQLSEDRKVLISPNSSLMTVPNRTMVVVEVGITLLLTMLLKTVLQQQLQYPYVK
jgi:hypothetical protein